MRRVRGAAWIVALLVSGPSFSAETTPANLWSRVAGPTDGPSEAIGGYAAGCLAGAKAITPDGPGFAVVRTSRRRFFGHPDLIDFIESLGARTQAAGLPTFYVGDMAQPRGGPLPFGHASHQTGLDADIWFTLDTHAKPTAAEREQPSLPSMLGQGGAIDQKLFGPRQVTLLRLATSDPRVDRIFVNPAIKLALCHGFGGATNGGTAWLGQLRPWWGHDDHFHVRLSCPEGSTRCIPQKPVPDGDGCGAELESWLARPLPPPAREVKPPKPALPSACAAVLAGR